MYSKSQFLEGITYFNLSIPNKSNVNIPAIFQQDSTQNIVDSSKTHNLAIVRFNLPTSLIPSTIVRTIPNPLNPLDMTYTPYNVSMEISNIGGSLRTENVTFVPEVNVDVNNPLYYYYYDPSQFLDIVNQTITATYNDMIAIDNTLPPNLPPFLNYNYDNKLYEFWVPIQLVTRVNSLKFYFNDALSNYFPIPSIINPNDSLLNSEIIVLDRNTNVRYLEKDVLKTQSYIVMSASGETRRLGGLQKVLIVTNYGLNINQEFVVSPTPDIKQNLNPPFNNNSSNNSLSIVTDFEVDFLQNNTQWIQFQSSGVGNYRLVEFMSNTSIQNFQIQIYYQDLANNIYPLYIKPDAFASIKLALVPKQYFASLYS